MTLLLLCDEFISSVTPVSVGGYQPPVGTGLQPSVSHLWGIVPDDLHALSSEDARAVEACWKALVQYASDVLVKTAHLDQTRSLLDFPLNYPVRWMPIEVGQEHDLAADTETLLDLGDGQSGPAVLYGDSETPLSVRLPANAQRAGAVIPLRSRLRGDTSLRWSWEGSVAQTVPGLGAAWVLLGWGALDAPFVNDRSGLYLAVSTEGDLGVLHVGRGAGNSVSAAAAEAEHSFYELSTTVDPAGFSVEVWWQPALNDLGGAASAELVIQAGEALEVLTLPLTQVVGGVSQVNTWEANCFGMWAPSRQALRFIAQLRGEGVAIVSPQRTFHTDMSLDRRVRRIPVLFPSPNSASGALRWGLDYDIVRGEAMSYLRTTEQMEDLVWAESAGLDLQLMRQIFGPLLPVAEYLEASDTERLRHQLVGGLYGLLRGPHPAALSLATGCLLGAPVALAPGQVIGFTSPLGEHAVVVQEVSRVRTYPIPIGLSPVVSVGDVVTQLQPLTEMPEVQDWVSAPERAADRFGELQKFASLLIDIPISFQTALTNLFYSAPPTVLEPTIEVFLNRRISTVVKRYLKHALAVWVGSLQTAINFVSTLDEEDAALDDEFGLSSRQDDPDYPAYSYDDFPRDRTTLTWDVGLTDYTPRLYNLSGDVYGEGEVDPCEDHTIPVYNEAERKILRDAVEFDFDYAGVDSGPLTVTIYDESVLLSHGDSHTFESREDWDWCPPDLMEMLDFSEPVNSGYLAGLL